MDPKIELEQLDAERATLLAKADTADFTAEDATRAEVVVKRMAELTDLIAKRDTASAALKAAGAGRTSDRPAPSVADSRDESEAAKGLTLGERFVRSKAMQDHRAANPLGVSGAPVSIKATDLGGLVAKAAGDPLPISSGLGGAVHYEREAGIVDLTYPKRLTLLDLITRGTTAVSYLEYRQLVSIVRAAAVVPERGLKPLSTLTTSTAQAAAYVIADGVKVTNQELADDGVIAALLDTVLTRNIWEKVEDLLFNGTGTNEPKGILNTTGVLQQDFSTDLVTTVRKAITTLRETSSTDVQAIVLSPEDDEELDLLKDGNDRFYGNGPFGIGPGTLWGRPRVVSSKVPVGTALLGDYRAIHLLERQGLTVEAFNQNEDDARHNLTYIRAEVRELLLIREPARLLVADVKGA